MNTIAQFPISFLLPRTLSQIASGIHVVGTPDLAIEIIARREMSAAIRLSNVRPMVHRRKSILDRRAAGRVIEISRLQNNTQLRGNL